MILIRSFPSEGWGLCWLNFIKEPVGGQRARHSEVRRVQDKPPGGAWLSLVRFPLFLLLLKSLEIAAPREGCGLPLREERALEFLDQSQLISRAFIFQLRGLCLDQSLNPDRCPPSLLRGVPLGPGKTPGTTPRVKSSYSS